MNALHPAESFEEARRRHLIQATIETLGDVGFRAASLSEIARRAKVSTGLFAHYFGDKDGLLEATLRYMAGSLTRETAAGLRTATTRRERLFAISDAALSDDQFESRTSAVWLAFWGQLTHSERYKRVQRIYQRRMTSNLKQALRGMVAPGYVDVHAVMIAAMIDGLWLRSHIGEGGVGGDGASARILVRSFIDGLLAGATTERTPTEPVRPVPVPLPEAPVEPVSHVSPVTGVELARFTPARATEIRRGLQDARCGFTAWAGTHAADRAEVLQRCAEALRREGAVLAQGESLETGRLLRITSGSDLVRAIGLLERAAAIAAGQAPSRVELASGRELRMRYRPAGLVVAHVPWSRCLVELCRLSAVLAQGNAVVACVDGLAGETASRLVSLFREAGLPEGALVTLRGDGETLAMLERQDGLLGTDTLRPVEIATDEAGPATRAKATVLVLPGADLERCTAALLDSAAPWRASEFLSEAVVYVHDAVRADLADRLAQRAGRLHAGHPLDAASDIGPLLSERHRSRVLDLLAADLRAGARVVAGGRALPAREGAPFLMAPTVLDGCEESSALVGVSTFSPVLTLIPFSNTAECVSRLRARHCNGTVALFAGEQERADGLADQIDRPLVLVNDHGERPSAPVGDRAGREPIYASLREIFVGRG